MASTSSTPSNVIMPEDPKLQYLDKDGRTDAEVYLTNIYDGKIIASKYMRKLADMALPWFHEEYHGHHFDLNYALRPVIFTEKFCCIPEGEKRGEPFIMQQFQRSAFELAYGFVDENNKRKHSQVVYEVARKNGKGLTLDTELPTPDGWCPIGAIHPGDYVFGQDGKPSRVIVESEIFDKPTYLFTFEDGSTLKATNDHIWTVRKDGGEWVDTDTEELIKSFGGSVWEVPIPEPVDYPLASLANDPYDVGYECAFKGAMVPGKYMIASVEQRRRLLCGMTVASEGRISTDGEAVAVNPLGDIIRDQIAELASSLGMMCTYSYEDDVSVIRRDRDGKRIVSIKHIPNEHSKCIAIDNPSHLYLAGRQYTATHNSSLIAALGLYHLMSDGEPGAEVYCCATSESQARKVYAAADQMRELSPALRKRIRRGMAQKNGRSALNYDKNGSMLAAIAANPKRKDGLSASAVIYDELAAVEDNGALLDQLEESGGSRRNFITWILSSENYITGGVWDERLSFCRGILDGQIQDDTVLPLLYTLDSRDEIYREECWIKANPGLYVIKDIERLRKRVNSAVQSGGSRMPSVLTKEFCLRSGAYSSYLDFEDCVNKTEIDFDEIGIPPYVCIGFDLATGGDLCGCVVRWKRPGDDKFYEIAKAWVPSERINMNTDGHQKDNVPYLLWSSQGQEFEGTNWSWVEIVEGDRINQMVIVDFIRDLVNVGMYPFCVAYDPWRVDDWTDRELKRLVGSSRIYAVPQTARVISPLMKIHKLDLHAKKVICPNPCLHQNRANVQARTDNNDNVFPQKKNLNQNNKIDLYMSELFSLAAYQKFEEEYLSAIGWTQEE